jgi:hypothetical protein
MQTPTQKFWDIRLQNCKEALEENTLRQDRVLHGLQQPCANLQCLDHP